MGPQKLPLSVLLALGLASCGDCGIGDEPDPRPCLSIAPDVLGPCLTDVEDPPVADEPPPDEEPPREFCLSIVPPPDEEPPADVCLSVEIEPDPEPPLRPCLSLRPPHLPEPGSLPVCLSEDVEPEPADDGGSDAGTERAPGERVALLGRLGDRLPADVLERL